MNHAKTCHIEDIVGRKHNGGLGHLVQGMCATLEPSERKQERANAPCLYHGATMKHLDWVIGLSPLTLRSRYSDTAHDYGRKCMLS